MDRAGNLYLSDALDGSLHRFRRRADGTLDAREECLLGGFRSAHGISISRDNVLYLGVLVRLHRGVRPKVIALPLDALNPCRDLPYTYETLKACVERRGYVWSERDLSRRDTPNGMVWVEREEAIYVTVERLLVGLLGRKGHIRRLSFDAPQTAVEVLKRLTPNGIDLDRSAGVLTLVVALTLKNSLCRIERLPGGARRVMEVPLPRGGHWLLGHLPDGLICMENRDVLVACFGSGQILCLPWADGVYGTPFMVAQGLGYPTDLTCGMSSTGQGTSLYVTAMRPLGKGRVVEIPNIGDVIEDRRVSTPGPPG